jgi:hypothetical protein
VEAARGFAEKILAAPKLKDDAARVEFAVQTALLRPAKPEERKSLLAFLAGQRAHFAANPTDADKLLRVGSKPRAALPAAEHAAWTSLARVILNLHETITRY